VEEERKIKVIRWYCKTFLNAFCGQCPFWGKVIGFQYSDKNSLYKIELEGLVIKEISSMPLKYPISTILKELLDESTLTRGRFLEHLGFKRIPKAIRKLDDFMLRGNGDILLIQRLIEYYPERKVAVLTALAETHKLLEMEASIEAIRAEKEARENFQPHIYIETERSIPSPIFVAALIGRRTRFIDFKMDNVSLETAQLTAREHFIKENGGSICNGKITGYRYVDTYDSSIRFDTKGNILEPSAGQFNKSFGASLSFGGRTVSQGELKRIGLSLPDETIN